jgi:transcriptional regulator with XRE-family HTH domain
MAVKREHQKAADEESGRARAALAANLKRWRTNADLTQKQLGDAAGISVSYVSMLERGERFPQPEVLIMLGTVLGKRWRDAFKGDHEPLSAAG